MLLYNAVAITGYIFTVLIEMEPLRDISADTNVFLLVYIVPKASYNV